MTPSYTPPPLYNLDLPLLLLQLMPPLLRRPLLHALMHAAATPLQQQATAMAQQAITQHLQLRACTQVCRMQHRLNTLFDPQQARIRLLSSQRRGQWVYAVDELGTNIPVITTGSHPTATGIVLTTAEELSTINLSHLFIIQLPTELHTRTAEISATVDQLRLPATSYIYISGS